MASIVYNVDLRIGILLRQTYFNLSKELQIQVIGVVAARESPKLKASVRFGYDLFIYPRSLMDRQSSSKAQYAGSSPVGDILMPYGVIGSTRDFDSGSERFEPSQGSYTLCNVFYGSIA